MDWSGGTGGRFNKVSVAPARRVGNRGIRLGSSTKGTRKPKRRSPAAQRQRTTTPMSAGVKQAPGDTGGWNAAMQMGSQLLESLKRLQGSEDEDMAIEKRTERPSHDHFGANSSVQDVLGVEDGEEAKRTKESAVPANDTTSPLLRQRTIEIKKRVDAAKREVKNKIPDLTEAEVNVHPVVKRAREWINISSKVGAFDKDRKAYESLGPEARARIDASSRIVQLHKRLEKRLKDAGIRPEEIDPSSTMDLTDDQRAVLSDASNATMKELMRAFMPKHRWESDSKEDGASTSTSSASDTVPGSTGSNDSRTYKHVDFSPDPMGLDVDHPKRKEFEESVKSSHAQARESANSLLSSLASARNRSSSGQSEDCVTDSLKTSQSVAHEDDESHGGGDNTRSGLVSQIEDLCHRRASAHNHSGFTETSDLHDCALSTTTLPLGDLPRVRVPAPPLRNDTRDSHVYEDAAAKTSGTTSPANTDGDIPGSNSDERDSIGPPQTIGRPIVIDANWQAQSQDDVAAPRSRIDAVLPDEMESELNSGEGTDLDDVELYPASAENADINTDYSQSADDGTGSTPTGHRVSDESGENDDGVQRSEGFSESQQTMSDLDSVQRSGKAHEYEAPDATPTSDPEYKTITRRSRKGQCNQGQNDTPANEKRNSGGHVSTASGNEGGKVRRIKFRSRKNEGFGVANRGSAKSASLDAVSLSSWARTALNPAEDEERRRNATAAMAASIADASSKASEKLTLSVLKPVFKVFDVAYTPPKKERCADLYEAACSRVARN